MVLSLLIERIPHISTVESRMESRMEAGMKTGMKAGKTSYTMKIGAALIIGMTLGGLIVGAIDAILKERERSDREWCEAWRRSFSPEGMDYRMEGNPE